MSRIAQPPGRICRAVAWAALLALPWCAGCSARRAARIDDDIPTAHAHALDVHEARQYLRAVRDSLPGSRQAALAQYALAYTNVFYTRETPEYDSALDAFIRFVNDYPAHEDAQSARAWIRALADLLDGRRRSVAYDSVSRERDECRGIAVQLQDSTEALREGLLGAAVAHDSLLARIRLLEDVIEAIGKNP